MARRPRPLYPFDERRAAAFLEALRSGRGSAYACRKSGLSERTVFAWIQHTRRNKRGPELEPYLRFREAYMAVIAEGFCAP